VGKIATIALAVTAVIVLLLAAGAVAIVQSLVGNSGGANCAPAGSTATSVSGFEPDQLTNAATIVAVGKQMNVPEQGWVIAVAAAIQESGLRNPDYGDRDSLGLFQQRPSQGWGTPAQIMDPTYAATQFYHHLLTVDSWQHLSVNDAAQAVQGSGTPTAYGQHEQSAQEVVGAIQGFACTTAGTGDCDNIQAPNAAAMAAINFACGQRGLPYVWGGNGPQDGGFDCSGLTAAAYAAAGIKLPRTAQTQYNAGPRVPAGQPVLPGDLVFYGTPANIHHVGLYIGAGKMINAPTFGKPVQVTNYRYRGDDYAGTSRPTAR
jgi:cell wall-associated NlpC family hydrolase